MIKRPLLAASAVLATTAALTWAAVGTAAAAPERFIAVCQERVCLLVLDTKTDTDGDGVTDVDEIQAGTDPADPYSYPGAPELLDWAIGGKLESFERHLTEIVVLPKVAPGGSTLATALGAFDLPEKAWLFNNPADALARIQGNGYSNILDVMASMARPESPAQSGLPPWGGAHGFALVSAGDGVSFQGSATFGPNGGKVLRDGDGLVGGHPNSEGGRTPEFRFGADGSVTHSYELQYTDGSHDEVTEWGERSGTNTTSYHSGTTSYDADGKKTGYTDTQTSTTTDPKTGETHSSTTSETTHFDPETGAKTGSTTTTVEVTISDGVKTTTTASIYYDADGNEIGGDVTETTEQCPNNKCDGGYTNTEYLAPGPITGEDFARVAARINSARTPGPDTGIDDAIGDAPPPSKWPLVALINEDGVVALAAGATPTFNRAQPEYDPRLREIAGQTGNPPQDNGNGTYGWPDLNG